MHALMDVIQVRCMMAILFLIGRKQEAPEVWLALGCNCLEKILFVFASVCVFAQIMAQLLDIKALTRKPAYDMAPDQGLMLYACEFDSLPMFRSSRKCCLICAQCDAHGSCLHCGLCEMCW